MPGSNYHKAVFGGGCFWCMVHPFESYKGVVSVTSGYTGGSTKDPTYSEVCTGKTGHVEVIEVIYDPGVISYEKLLDIFWRQIDPTDAKGQFVDRGSQYASVIFYSNEEQKTLAEQSKKELDASGIFPSPVVTDIRPLDVFYPAEDYHQDYHKKSPQRYQFYRMASGRDNFLKKVWIRQEKA